MWSGLHEHIEKMRILLLEIGYLHNTYSVPDFLSTRILPSFTFTRRYFPIKLEEFRKGLWESNFLEEEKGRGTMVAECRVIIDVVCLPIYPWLPKTDKRTC